MVGGCKLLYYRALCKGYVIFIRRDYLVGILLCCTLNHLEKRRGHLLPVDDECSAKDFVTAVL